MGLEFFPLGMERDICGINDLAPFFDSPWSGTTLFDTVCLCDEKTMCAATEGCLPQQGRGREGDAGDERVAVLRGRASVEWALGTKAEAMAMVYAGCTRGRA